jgi:hypothetical protein
MFDHLRTVPRASPLSLAQGRRGATAKQNDERASAARLVAIALQISFILLNILPSVRELSNLAFRAVSSDNARPTMRGGNRIQPGHC